MGERDAIAPYLASIDREFIDYQPTVLADRFDRVRGDSVVALGALVRTRFRPDVLVESALVDVSGSPRSHRVQGTRQFGAHLTH
nr:hypothetical protein [Halanaeroarchaeum sp. HSR-CO]